MKKKKGLGFFRGNKKGSVITDCLFWVVVIFIFALVSIFVYQAFDDFQPDLLNDLRHNESKAVLSDVHSRYPSTLDGAIVVAFFLLWGLVIVASFMLDTHPIFFIFTLILLVFIIIVGIVIADAYDDLSEDSDLSAAFTNFPYTNKIFSNYLIVTAGIGLSIGISLFAKMRLGT